MIEKTSILERITNVDLRKLPIDAREAFVLSQVDGVLTVEELADLVGVDIRAAEKMASKLVDVGAVSIKGAPKRRRSTKSVKMPRVSTRMKAAEVCELDAEQQKAIEELHAKVLLTDHYGRLGLARDAEKKAVKRAYFALAAKVHPDRFFGKKLGPMKPVVDRVFRLVTEAHDTLVDADKRSTYDATLPRVSVKPPPKSTAAPPKISVKPPPRVSVKPPRKSTKPPARTSRRPSRKLKIDAAEIPVIVPPPAKMPDPIPSQSPTLSADRIKSLLAGTREVRSKERADLLVKAAEEAMAKGDVIGASNNYRLALEHRDDPYVRAKLDDVDRLAKQVRFDRYLNRAKNAEKEKAWADAAENYERAFECKKDAAVAERIAASLHLSGGDRERALSFAEQAVSMRGGNMEYRITFAEVLFAAGEAERAREQIDKALEIAPKDARAKELSKVFAAKKR